MTTIPVDLLPGHRTAILVSPPPEGAPTVSHLVFVIFAPWGALDFMSSMVADLSKPALVTDPPLTAGQG